MIKLDFIDRDIKVKENPDFKVISTFSGCGGSSTGYVWAGGKVLLAVEWDDNAVDTYHLNYPETDIFHGDIATLSVDEVLSRTGLKLGELDIFDGSPPCQGFSTAGKRNLNDKRNQLFREYVRLLRGLKPKVFVMENVSGMVKGKMKILFAEILTELKESGYRVSARLVNAKHMGVPQQRTRLIFIGVREDLNIAPSHPLPQRGLISVKRALQNVDVDEAEIEYLMTECATKSSFTHWEQVKVGRSVQDITGSGFSGIKINPVKPSPCVLKNNGNLGMHGLMHWNEKRRLTLAEFKRIASYPDCYQFVAKKVWGDGVARIGNSVPPEMMRQIAVHIKENILAK